MVERQVAEKPAVTPSLEETMYILKSRGGRKPKRWLMYNPFSKFIASMYSLSRPRFNETSQAESRPPRNNISEFRSRPSADQTEPTHKLAA